MSENHPISTSTQPRKAKVNVNKETEFSEREPILAKKQVVVPTPHLTTDPPTIT